MDVSVLFRNFAPTKMTTEENKDWLYEQIEIIRIYFIRNCNFYILPQVEGHSGQGFYRTGDGQ